MAANPAGTAGPAANSDLAQEIEPGLPAPGAETDADATPLAAAVPQQQKWPGWPGDNVFRLIVPVNKVGSIIGRKGELIKKLCDESRAKVRILEGAAGTSDRVVLISAREEPEAALSPAMDAALRVFKRINDISDNDVPATLSSIKLLVSSSQAITLIGKQGASVKSIQENSGATVRILPKEELPYYATAEERIVEIQGETLKVLKALEAVVSHLRKFLVDHSILPLFEKSLGTQPTAQDPAVDSWNDRKQSSIHSAQQTGNDYSLSLNRDPYLLDRRTQIDVPYQRSRLSIYGQDPAISGLHTPALGRAPGSFIAQITQTMHIPLTYAEEIIGIGGGNISFIRRTSGAVITLEESRTVADEIIVEIKGNSTQVQAAQQLIEDVVSGHREPPTSSSYGSLDTSYRPSYSALSGSSYSSLSGSGYLSSSLTSRSLSGYGSSGLGGYGGYRL